MTTTTTERRSSANIELGLYSGRQDPSWTIAGPEKAHLDLLLSRLRRVAGAPVHGGLGYHGFTIFETGRTLVAFRGQVELVGSGRRHHLADPQRTIEQFLLQSGGAHLSDSQVTAVRLAVTSTSRGRPGPSR